VDRGRAFSQRDSVDLECALPRYADDPQDLVRVRDPALAV
jgi:hypothetical protein